MGERGPIGKRDEERRRRNKPTTETIKVDLSQTLMQEVEIPAPSPEWHDIARDWYLSLTRSGQAVFYEDGDWHTAYVLAETLSRALSPIEVKTGEREIEMVVGETEDGEIWRKTGKDYVFEAKPQVVNAATLNALLKGMSALMVTEGDRRRLQIELDRERARKAVGEGQNVIPITQQRADRLDRAR